MDYRVIRSDRKTLALQISREGEVLVRAPRRVSQREIDRFVQSHRDWVETHAREVRQRNQQKTAFSLREGDEICICGEKYRVHLVPGLKATLRKKTGELILSDGDMDRQRQAILNLAKKDGRTYLLSRLDHWSRIMGIDYSGLRLSTARSRWGSCSTAGSISISLFLLFAAPEDVDYVLIHELSHRRHFDHSPAFWALVAQYCPDYGSRKKTLKALARSAFLQSLAERG